MSPKVSTSGAGPVRSYQTVFIRKRFQSERARECTTVEQDVLPGDEACPCPAEKRAGQPKFLGVAEASGGIEFCALRHPLVHPHTSLPGIHLRAPAAPPAP